MRQLLITALLLIVFSVNSEAQRYPLKKLYAYKQKVVGGKNDVIEKQRQSKTLYHIYLELQPGSSITISGLWINKQQYQFDTAVAVTPVAISSSLKMPGKNATIQLVSATASRVIKVQQLQPSLQNIKQPVSLKDFEVLIKYSSKGKIYYAGSRKCTTLQPVLMK
jgi:hypothetical protein